MSSSSASSGQSTVTFSTTTTTTADQVADFESRSDEIAALESIYGDEFQLIEAGDGNSSTTISITIHSSPIVLLHLTLPSNYPSVSPPSYSFSCPSSSSSSSLSGSHLSSSSKVKDALQSLYREGEVCGYEWIEWVREYVTNEVKKGKEEEEMEAKEEEIAREMKKLEVREANTVRDGSIESTFSSSSVPSVPPSFIFVSGSPLTDRHSVFQAHVTSLSSPSLVSSALSDLKSNTKIVRATHNIYAYRIQMPSHRANTNGNRNEGSRVVNEIWSCDHDDDGEDGAGSRLSSLLLSMNCVNVLVVVTRWYGGIQLGNDRFKHICNVARELLIAEKYTENNNRKGGGKASDKKEKKNK